MRELVLYSRQGCCLCEGLEQRLLALDLEQLGLRLLVVDIDEPSFPAELRGRYDLEVPVLAVDGEDLPRVSPRLAGEGLFAWLQRARSSGASAT